MTSFERQWQARFEKFATRHRSDHLVSGWSAVGLRRRLAVFEGLLDGGILAAGARVLELGCGAGTYVRLLAKRGHPVIGLDYSLPSLRRAVAADLARAGAYLAGDAAELPFRAGAFKAVTCIGVVQALGEPRSALAEIARVLEPSGVVMVETLNPWSPLAATRRLRALLRREPTKLHYSAPRAIERTLAAQGLRPVQRLSVLLPPRSWPGLERTLSRPQVVGAMGLVPGFQVLAPQAYWIVAVKG